MPELQPRFQFSLRHTLITVTIGCVLLALAVVSPLLAIIVFVVALVGGGMASISTRSRRRWIVGPIFALYGGFGGLVFGFALSVTQEHSSGVFILAVLGVFFGGWFAGHLERKHASVLTNQITETPSQAIAKCSWTPGAISLICGGLTAFLGFASSWASKHLAHDDFDLFFIIVLGGSCLVWPLTALAFVFGVVARSKGAGFHHLFISVCLCCVGIGLVLIG